VSRLASWRHPFAGPARRALGFFSIQATFTRGAVRAPEHIEDGWGYDPRLHALPATARLRGYFQSARYWRGHEAQIRADLAPARLPRDRAFEALCDEIDRSTAVALHVRRGDYLTTERDLHLVCTDAYYERAVRHIRERVSGAAIYVFSADAAWCRERYAAAPGTTVVDLPASKSEPGLDLHLMSRCRHHVVSNSTYSWWGAWLANGEDQIVCVPARWFNDAAMSAAAMRDTVPAHWQRIACGPSDEGGGRTQGGVVLVEGDDDRREMREV
jgi:hypothetical protein